jgi:hypothetical protein
MSSDEQGGGQSRDEETPRHGESPAQRFDRNWNELLQELRVTQTGTQIISGFLLTLAFQPRFDDLDNFQVTLYVILVLLAACSTALGLSPVGLHRTLFRQHKKPRVVLLADRLVKATVAVTAMLTAGVVLFILDIVAGRAFGIAAGVATMVLLIVLLIFIPRAAGQD